MTAPPDDTSSLRRSLPTLNGGGGGAARAFWWDKAASIVPRVVQASLFLFSSGPKAISNNKMSLGSATTWPSNHTWLWIHLLMGEK